MGSKRGGGMKQMSGKAGLPPSPYGSPPIYLPFSAVDIPLQQNPSQFISSAGHWWLWYPFAPVCEPGWNAALQAVPPIQASPYRELIDYQMPVGEQDMIIPFEVEKVSPVILLSGPMIANFLDANPLTGLAFTVLNMSTSLLVIQLNALLPAGDPATTTPESPLSNYRFKAMATVVG